MAKRKIVTIEGYVVTLDEFSDVYELEINRVYDDADDDGCVEIDDGFISLTQDAFPPKSAAELLNLQEDDEFYLDVYADALASIY